VTRIVREGTRCGRNLSTKKRGKWGNVMVVDTGSERLSGANLIGGEIACGQAWDGGRDEVLDVGHRDVVRRVRFRCGGSARNLVCLENRRVEPSSQVTLTRPEHLGEL
jgi:hypothetical protein